MPTNLLWVPPFLTIIGIILGLLKFGTPEDFAKAAKPWFGYLAVLTLILAFVAILGLPAQQPLLFYVTAFVLGITAATYWHYENGSGRPEPESTAPMSPNLVEPSCRDYIRPRLEAIAWMVVEETRELLIPTVETTLFPNAKDPVTELRTLTSMLGNYWAVDPDPTEPECYFPAFLHLHLEDVFGDHEAGKWYLSDFVSPSDGSAENRELLYQAAAECYGRLFAGAPKESPQRRLLDDNRAHRVAERVVHWVSGNRPLMQSSVFRHVVPEVFMRLNNTTTKLDVIRDLEKHVRGQLKQIFGSQWGLKQYHAVLRGIYAGLSAVQNSYPTERKIEAFKLLYEVVPKKAELWEVSKLQESSEDWMKAVTQLLKTTTAKQRVGRRLFVRKLNKTFPQGKPKEVSRFILFLENDSNWVVRTNVPTI